MAFTNMGPNGQFPNVSGEHGCGGKDGRVGRRHDGGRDGAQSDHGDGSGREMLENQRQYHFRLIPDHVRFLQSVEPTRKNMAGPGTMPTTALASSGALLR